VRACTAIFKFMSKLEESQTLGINVSQ
jgi:hypothetical protein